MTKTNDDVGGRSHGPRLCVLLLSVMGGVACGVSGTATPSTGPGQGGSTGTGGAPGGSSGTGGIATGGTSGSGGTGGRGMDASSGAGGVGGKADASSPGASDVRPGGVTINIGGVDVPRENVIAFINFGHSNMAGRGVGPPATRPYFFGAPDPHAWMYHSGQGFAPAVEPRTAGDGGNDVNGMVSGGPSTALVKEAAALAPGKYFVTIPLGVGSAYCSQFLPGSLYYNRVIAGAKELKGKVTFAAIVILLGITERHGTQADIDNYPQCINKLVTAIRTDVGEPNLPLLLNDYEMGTTGPLVPTSAFATAIRPKILMVPGVVSNSAIIPTDNPIIQIEIDNSTNDEHHFSLDGHKEYVRRVLQTMKGKGWFPW
jgi:hypothetical protein